MLKLTNYLVSGALALSIIGCASSPRELQSVADARATLQRAESSPLAGEVAVKEIEEAHAALREAEELQRKHRSEKEISNAAYVAKRHAQIAQEQIMTAAAKRAQEQAGKDRQAIVLDAREREIDAKAQEADRARMAAEAAKQDANAAKQDANAARDQARAAGDAAALAQQTAEQERLQAEQERQRTAQLEQQLRDLNAKKTERGYVLTLGDVLFDTAQATLKPGAIGTIDRLASFLKDANDRSVMIEGHTDSIGSDSYNQELSERRASAVREALLSRGVAPERVAAIGKGKSFPIASNESSGGRQQNRRVEIVIENPARSANVISR